MFEIIGILAVWAAGAAASYSIPLIIGMLYSDTNKGNLAHAIIGYQAGRALLVLYIGLTFLYFVIT